MTESFSKNVHIDDVAKNFIENLYIEKPLYEMEPEDARKFLSNLQRKYHFDIDAEVEDIEIFDDEAGNINIKLVRPKNCTSELLPLIIYCHGGGWVIGDFEDYDMTVKTIANCTKSTVAFIEYSHAPEFPYPHALKQIYKAVDYLFENADEYNLDREYIAIAGDSAGGNMAAAIAMKIKKTNKIKLCFQALLYPVTDAEMKSESYREFKNGPWLSQKAMEWFWKSYLCDKDIKKEPYISPVQTKIEDLKDLPPTLIITAENDVLRDEGEEYARKLIEAGVDTACVRINNTFHDFMMLNALRESKATKAGYKLVCKFLKHALHPDNICKL